MKSWQRINTQAKKKRKRNQSEIWDCWLRRLWIPVESRVVTDNESRPLKWLFRPNWPTDWLLPTNGQTRPSNLILMTKTYVSLGLHTITSQVVVVLDFCSNHEASAKRVPIMMKSSSLRATSFDSHKSWCQNENVTLEICWRKKRAKVWEWNGKSLNFMVSIRL